MKLHVNFEENSQTIYTKFIETSCNFNINFGEVFLIPTGDKYEGDYEVTPRVSEQVLETKGLVMKDDITIFEIPKVQVLNIKNGYTVTIG